MFKINNMKSNTKSRVINMFAIIGILEKRQRYYLTRKDKKKFLYHI